MSNMNRFLGGSPGAVLTKLVFLSLLAGAFMAFLDITPFGLVEGFYHWLRSLLNVSMDTVVEVGRWIGYGAVIVVPLWLLSRLFGQR